jgi:hypothetical protein
MYMNMNTNFQLPLLFSRLVVVVVVVVVDITSLIIKFVFQLARCYVDIDPKIVHNNNAILMTNYNNVVLQPHYNRITTILQSFQYI